MSIALVGPGARNIDIVRQLEPQGLIMAGLGGALSPELALGDVVMQGDVPTCFPGLQHRLFVGTVATVEAIVATPGQKAALFRETGALAVDMETQPARFLAERLQVPFLAVRAISDTAAETLDADLLRLVDQKGHSRVDRAMLLLARRPSRLGELLRLRRASNLALGNLAATVVAVVRAGWPRTTA